MKRTKAFVFFQDKKAGLIEKISTGYRFQYFPEYLSLPEALPVSLTLGLSDQPYESKTLFPFFTGLLPEGWLLDIFCKTLKIDPDDGFELLISTCRDCIGAVSIIPPDNGGAG